MNTNTECIICGKKTEGESKYCVDCRIDKQIKEYELQQEM